MIGWDMDKGLFYRVNVVFAEPERLDRAFRQKYQRQLDNNSLYLGIRFNPTSQNQSAVINSIELANEYMSLAKEVLTEEYGHVGLFLNQFQYSNDYMKSIIDTDSRILANRIENYEFKANPSLVMRIANSLFKR